MTMKHILILITLALFTSCAKDEEVTQRDAPAPLGIETVYIVGVNYGNAAINNMPTVDGVYKIEQGGLTVMQAERMYFRSHATDMHVNAVETQFICGWQDADGFNFWVDTFTVDLGAVSGEVFVERNGRNFLINLQ